MSIPIFEDGSLASRLLIHAGPRFAGLPNYRFEFNPAVLGVAGVNRVLEILNSVFIEPSHHLLRNSIVTRIDVALDLHGLSVEEMIVRSIRQRVHGIFSNQHGTPATQYLGKSKANQSVVYTKEGDDGPMLRVERRIHPRCRASQLQFLPNPFNVIQMVHTDALRPFLTGMIPVQFFDSVRVRGFTHVLATLPPAQRRALKAVLRDPAQSLLPSMEEIWRTWPDLLKSSGFGFLVDHPVEEVGLVPNDAREKVDSEA